MKRPPLKLDMRFLRLPLKTRCMTGYVWRWPATFWARIDKIFHEHDN